MFKEKPKDFSTKVLFDVYYGNHTADNSRVRDTLPLLSDDPELNEQDKQIIRSANEKVLKCMDKCIAKATAVGRPRSCIQKLRKERNHLAKMVSD